mgnify:CR=1 FL=1
MSEWYELAQKLKKLGQHHIPTYSHSSYSHSSSGMGSVGINLKCGPEDGEEIFSENDNQATYDQYA